MELQRPLFNKANNCISLAILIIASFTYLMTIEPTASFWDCGEFIASSFKLEVGHPPGNPVFQIIACFFTLFADPEHAAMMVNAMSALCSAFTIFFLYFTIVHLARRIVEKEGKPLDLGSAITIFGAGIVGSLAYCWSDTFWFSAVEGEVYAMSSLFTAIVFWAMLKWEEQADSPYANRWIVLIAFLMGLSIGVHLLNLLTIPALVFLYYFKKYKVTRGRTVKVLLLSAVILAFILFGIIPYVPKIAAYVDLFFVNVLGFGLNLGATLFMLALFALLFILVYKTYKKGKVLLNTIALCTLVMIIGYSVFAVVVIRSSAMTPTNEYQPDNPFTLVRYLAREQYGSNPIIYGKTFASPFSAIKNGKYYNVYEGKYIKVDSPAEPVYDSDAKMLFPRMCDEGVGDKYVSFYNRYTNGEGRAIPGARYKMPTFGANLSYFLDYQLEFMYIRYFMWNFAGRQNDLQAVIPGDLVKGNWESGIGFLDKARLGDQSEGPDYLINNRAKNHFYFLPLILGLIGLFFQLAKDKRNWVVVMLLFILTGVAVVVYLNQTPMQARERDYAYAGSFYAFAIWIGFAVLWLRSLLQRLLSARVSAVVATLMALVVPLQMVSQTWDDHDRSGRYFVRDMAYNYLVGLDRNALIFTHGDNDTFPLWYIQEVEGVRTDVRIMNTSLLGTDWYIDQMKYKMYDSDPVPLKMDRMQYLFGTNDWVQIYERFNSPITVKQTMDIFKNPKVTITLSDGKKHNYIVARKLRLPVNKENVKRYGIVAEKDYNNIADTLELNISEGKSALSKTELVVLDLLSNYNWDRPIYFMQKGGDIDIGIKDYLQYDGFVYKFVPIKSSTGHDDSFSVDQVDEEALYDRVMNLYRWDNFKDTTLNMDYQHILTFNNLISPRDIMVTTAGALYDRGKPQKAKKVLDKMMESIPQKTLPLNTSYISGLNDRAVIDAIELYMKLGSKTGDILAERFLQETIECMKLFSKVHGDSYISYSDLYQSLAYMVQLQNICTRNGRTEMAARIEKTIKSYIS